jgi:hypothetical protein
MRRRLRAILYSLPGVLVGAVAAEGCGKVANENEPTADYIDPGCNFVCPAEGVEEGNFAISGSAGIDGFFASVLRFHATATGIVDGLQRELDALGASVGAKPGDVADLKQKLDAKLRANVDGALTIHYEPPACTVSAQATLEAAARCDASIDSASASVECDGSCAVGAGVACRGGETLTCTGPAPDLLCTGTCNGDCALTKPAACSGVCRGTCMGTCTVKAASGDCAGYCDGMCTGSCTLDAPGECDGLCKGLCSYTPPEGVCDTAAQVTCRPNAKATIACRGFCNGGVTLPEAKAECAISARTDARVDADCKPPKLAIAYQLAPRIANDAPAAASFQAWLSGFERHVSAILAYKGKLDGLASAGTSLAGDAESAMKNSISLALKGQVTLVTAFGFGCALRELPGAIGLARQATTALAAQGKDVVDVLTSIGIS